MSDFAGGTRPFGYIDTNLIIRCADGADNGLFEWLQDMPLHCVYSDTTLSDLKGARDIEARMEVLDALNARHISYSDIHRGCILMEVKASQRMDHWRNLPSTEPIEEALDTFSIFAHGGKSAGMVGEIFDIFAQKTVEQLQTMLANDEELSLEEKAEYQAKVIEKLWETSRVADEKADVVLPEILSRIPEIKPPNVLAQFITLLSKEDSRWFRKALASEQPAFEKYHQAALYLSLLGFGRDKRVRKDILDNAMKGAKADRHDTQHIAYGLNVHLLLSADRGLLRRAFTLAEYYNVPSHMLRRAENGWFLLPKGW